MLGVGLVRLVDFVTEPEVAAGRLQKLLTDYHIDDVIPLHAVYAPGRHRSPKVAAMVEFLVETFGGAPWRRR